MNLEWEVFIKGHSHAGVLLRPSDYFLVWSWDVWAGFVSTKGAYEAIVYERPRCELSWWNKDIWKWDIPLKLQCFMWLALENKILIADNFIKRWGSGPNIFLLCFVDEETIFVSLMSFVRSIER